MNRTTSPWLAALTSVFILVLVAACGGSSAGWRPPHRSPGTERRGAERRGAERPRPSAAASEGTSSAAPSLAIPSFVLPNDDKGLEALLPDEMCGGKATKLSFGGSRFAGVADDELHRRPWRPSARSRRTCRSRSRPGRSRVAASAPTSAGVFRIKGVDPGRLHDVFLAEVAKEGPVAGAAQRRRQGCLRSGRRPTPTPRPTRTSTATRSFFVTAKNDDDAAAVLKVMP